MYTRINKKRKETLLEKNTFWLAAELARNSPAPDQTTHKA
jgi:hypothetical protein